MKDVGGIYVARAADKTCALRRASPYVGVLHRAPNINAAERGEMEIRVSYPLGMIGKGAAKFGARMGDGKVQLRAARYSEMKSLEFY